MDTTAIAFDGRQRRIMGILLIQPLWNAVHQFRDIVATCILCAVLELVILTDCCIVNIVSRTYCAIKLLCIIWLGLVNLLLEIGDKPSEFFQRICAAGITV